MQIGIDETAPMSAEQQALYQEIKSGPRGAVPLVFLVLLDAPELARMVQAVGRYIRYESSLPADVRELAILTLAATLGSGYEWSQHFSIARNAGVSLADCEAARVGNPQAMSKDMVDMARFCLALSRRETIDDGLTDALTRQFGRRGLTELTVIVGYYPLLANGLTVANVDIPVPERLA